MRTPQENWAQQTRSALEDCFSQMRLAQATELARSRRFLEAEALLAVNGRLPNTARELDLLARILAQQNRLREARRCWEAALQISPDNETYRSGLKRVGQVEGSIKFRRQSALVGGAVLLVVMLVAVSMKLLSSRAHGKPKQPAQRTQTTAPVTPRPSPQTAPAQAVPPPSQQKPIEPRPPQPSPSPQKR